MKSSNDAGSGLELLEEICHVLCLPKSIKELKLVLPTTVYITSTQVCKILEFCDDDELNDNREQCITAVRNYMSAWRSENASKIARLGYPEDVLSIPTKTTPDINLDVLHEYEIDFFKYRFPQLLGAKVVEISDC